MATDLYAKVPLSVKADSESVFIFPGTTPPSTPLTLIVYFHGKDVTSIRSYLTQPVTDLKSVVETAKETVVLAAPTLTTDAQAGDDFSLKTYLPALAAALQKQNPGVALPDLSKADSFKRIILAAHSGGGKVMLATCQMKSDTEPFAQKITDCWGLDCLYGPLHQNAVPCPADSAKPDAWRIWETNQKTHREVQWATWLNANRNVKFTLYWTTQGGTQTRAENLKKLAARKVLPNVTVEFLPGVDHYGSILTGFARLLPTKGS